jgi:hypothetical protein
VDYHSQYDASAFLDSLRDTRVRQSAEMVARIPAIGEETRVLDFGSGRGWFLEACKARGIERLGGADTSALAIRALGGMGIPGILLDDFEARGVRGTVEKIREGLGFAPTVVSLLDVLEHFETEQANELLAALRDAFRESLRLLVVKIPVSEGILFRLASMLAAIGMKGPLEQLYQVGTFPPHFHYFSRRSLRAILGKAGFEIVDDYGDPDFEGETFSTRVHALSRLPRPFGRMIGKAAFTFAKVLDLGDSRIVFARPKGA